MGRWIAALAFGVAVSAVPVPCPAQPNTPRELTGVEFTDFGGHVDFVLRWRDRDQTSKTTPSETRSEETIFEESLTLETEGYIYHPNFLEFGLAGTFGLTQEEFEEVVDGQERSSTQDGELYEFDVDALIFKKRAFPITVFAHRGRGLVPRPFLPSLETTTTNYGFTWQYVSKKTPINLQFSHTDAKLSPLLVARGPDDEGRQKNTELRFEAAYHFSDHHVLSLLYEYESVEEEPFEVDYDANEITLTHRLGFGDRHRHHLRSEINYRDQHGTIDLERVRWREDLRLEHSDTLQSRFRFEALDRRRGTRSGDVADVDEESFLLSGSLRHQLYQSLTSQVRLFARKQEFEPDLDITRWGGQANATYRKTNPWGVLHANYGFRVEWNDQDGPPQVAEVIDEPQTFQDPDPIILRNRNILVGSISLKAQDRVTIYQRGRDFVLRLIGNLVEIERVVTGRISNGETVLVDYRFSFGGSFDLDTVAHQFGIRQDFEFGLTPYYRFDWQDQSLSPASATGAIAEDITAHVVGIEYRKAALRLFAEYEDHDSTINPFISSRYGASYAHKFKSGAETSLHLRYTDTSHGPPTRRDITLFTCEGRHRHPLTPNLTVEGSVLYRNGEDSVSRDTEGFDVSLALEWSIRETDIKVSFEHRDFEDEFTENDSSALFVHLRRGI